MRQSPAPTALGAEGALRLRSSKQREVTKPRAHHDSLLVRPGWLGPLRRPLRAGRPRVDALVVPAARDVTVEDLERLAGLATRLGAVLVVVASHDAAPSVLVQASSRHPHVAVVDMAGDRAALWARLLPDLATDRHPLGRAGLPDDWDTALKRNVALALARALGWRTVLFLDDDILFDAAKAPFAMRELAVGCALVERGALSAAGWVSVDFPDNSVVCHARRLARLEQGVFVGAGALLVGVDADTPFFPRVYNEDWLFQYPLLRTGPADVGRLAVLGQVRQQPYEPFRAERAAREELGDVLAEGLYQLRDAAVGGLGPARGDVEDPTFWKDVVSDRAEMIGRIRDRLAVTPADRSAADRQRSWGRKARRFVRGFLARPVQPLWRAFQTVHRASVRDRARAALAVSLEQHDLRPGDVALPDALASWVTAWRSDLRAWREHRVPVDLARALLEDPATTPFLGSGVLPEGLVTPASV